MRCDTVREALSARLDGEPAGADGGQVEDHLAGCAACRVWLRQAEQVTRLARTPALVAPDLTERILAAAHREDALPRPAARPVPAGGRWTAVLRGALAALALVQLVISAPELVGAVGHEAHAGREVAAFDIALAVGLLLVASYPQYARIFAPVVSTLVVCFATISAVDVAQGVVSPARVAVHAIALAQAAAVWLLARGPRRMGMMPR